MERLPGAAANASHSPNDPLVKGSKFAQRSALKQMDISANKPDVLIFLYQALHVWHTRSSLRSYIHSFAENMERIGAVGEAARWGLGDEPSWGRQGQHLVWRGWVRGVWGQPHPSRVQVRHYVSFDAKKDFFLLRRLQEKDP